MAEDLASMEASTSVSMGAPPRKRNAHRSGKTLGFIEEQDEKGQDEAGSMARKKLFARSFPGSGGARSYKLRANIRAIDRFDPFASSPAELARKRRREEDKRRRELEDDAGTTLRGSFSASGASAASSPISHWKNPRVEAPQGKDLVAEKIEPARERTFGGNVYEGKMEKIEEMRAPPPPPPPPSPPSPPPMEVFAGEDRKATCVKVSSRPLERLSTIEDRAHKVKPEVPGLGKTKKRKVVKAGVGNGRLHYTEEDDDDIKQVSAKMDLALRRLKSEWEAEQEELKRKMEEVQERMQRKMEKMEQVMKDKMMRLEEQKLKKKTSNAKKKNGSAYSPVHKGFDRAWDDPVFKVPRSVEPQERRNKKVDHIGADEFREKLRREISRPFDAQELRDKLKTLRYIRSGGVGKSEISYLEQYPDFAVTLNQALEREDKLRLLREFSVWVKHAYMEKPWTRDITPPQHQNQNPTGDGVIVID